jgi:hypothetical protein
MAKSEELYDALIIGGFDAPSRRSLRLGGPMGLQSYKNQVAFGVNRILDGTRDRRDQQRLAQMYGPAVRCKWILPSWR